ncbi:MAG: aminopeptidase, partial [Phycisphaerales bacterium]
MQHPLPALFAGVSIAAFASITTAHPPLAEDHELHDGPWLAIEKLSQPDKFRQLEEILPTPNAFRTASGAPGPEYWQNRADYRISVRLDDERHRIEGVERVVYFNESPDTLRYLWMQLDPNRYAKDSQALLSDSGPDLRRDQDVRFLRQLEANRDWTGGVTIEAVETPDGSPLEHVVVGTMMRIDLPDPLESGETFEFSVRWNYPMREKRQGRGRSLYEWFPEDDNALYLVSKWFPRMCAYTDATGWQHKQFLGRGEFTLEFGNYEVAIDVPETHVVAPARA